MGTEDNWQSLVAADQIAEGEMQACDIGDFRIALYNVKGEFYATDNICTHAFAVLTDGWLDDVVIECPLHGGSFNVCTGKASCQPAEIDLKTYPVRVVDGKVEVHLP